MALVVYNNGIIEELISNSKSFSDKELVSSFENYSEIRTFRLEEISNCWCVWGFTDTPPSNEFFKLASEIVDEDVFSHMIFVHDSEINEDWNLTDKIIYRSYQKFIKEIGEYISEMQQHIQNEIKKDIEGAEKDPSMVFLSAVGHTKDKRVLFAFNPNEQNDNFYIGGGWDSLCVSIHEYLKNNFNKEPIEKNKPFVIFADTKTIVIIEDQYFNQVIDEIIKRFEKLEKYEICSKISEIKDIWLSKKTEFQLDASIGPKKSNKRKLPKKK
jgi:DNA-directed RNA polymerase beta subunit